MWQAIADRRVLGASEVGIVLGGALVLLTGAVVALCWPRVLAWPLALLGIWAALGLIVRSVGVVRRARSRRHLTPQRSPGEPTRADAATVDASARSARPPPARTGK